MKDNTFVGLDVATFWNDATAAQGTFTLTVTSTSTNYAWYIDDVLQVTNTKTLTISKKRILK